MSLLWMDGFEWLGTSVGELISSTYILTKYATANSLYVRDGRTGGYAAGGQGGYAVSITTPTFSDANTTYIVGFGLRVSTSANATIDILRFSKSGAPGVGLQYTPSTGEISVRDRSDTELGVTAGAGLLATGWYYIEVKVVDAASGSVTILVNGETVCSLTSVDTSASSGSGYNRCTFSLSNASVPYLRLDDVYILNGAGSTCNDFLGNVEIRAIWPIADGDLSEWGLSDGTDHYALIDDNPHTTDTDYTTADTTVSDLFDYGAATDMGPIKAVQVNSCARELAEAAAPTMKNLVKVSSTVYDYSTPAITSGYKMLYSIIEINPATAGSWDVTSLNAAQFGLKRE